MQDLFATLQFPRLLVLSEKDLGQRYRQLSWEWHPDRRPREEQAAAMQQTALLNEAYRILRDPFSRAQHLLELEGMGIPTTPPQAMLMEIFEVQELIEDADTPQSVLEQLLIEWQQRFDVLRATLEQTFILWDQGDQGALVQLQQLLVQRKYLASIVEKVEERVS